MPELCQLLTQTAHSVSSDTMPSLARYIRGIRQVGIKEWWHQMQYIGDVKAGTFMGKDQCVENHFCESIERLNAK